jgi:hypothetical protein
MLFPVEVHKAGRTVDRLQALSSIELLKYFQYIFGSMVQAYL